MKIDLSVFGQTDGNQVRVFMILFCLTLATQMVLNLRTQFRYFRTQPARIYGNSPLLLGFFHVPIPGLRLFCLLGLMFTFSLVCAAIGIFTRFFLFTAFVCYFPYFSSISSLASVQRKTNLIPFVLLVLVVCPSTAAQLDANSVMWPIVLVKILLAQMYFSAGVQKLRRGGWGWWKGESLQAYLATHFLWGDMKRALALAKYPRLCKLLSLVLLIFELTFWLILFFPFLTAIYVVTGIVFHITTGLTMRINYFRFVGPVYTVFIAGVVLQISRHLHLF